MNPPHAMTDQKTTETATPTLASLHAANELSIRGALADAFRTIKGHEAVASVIDGYFEQVISAALSRLEASQLREAELAKALKALREAEWMVTHDWGGDRTALLNAADAALQSPASQNNPKETKA